MQDVALKVVILMYSLTISVLGGQYVAADVVGIDLTNTWTDSDGDGNADNIPLKAHLLTLIDTDAINEHEANIVSGNFTGNTTYYNRVETFTTGGAFDVWELIQIISGTYIFNFAYLMGMPLIFVTLFVIIYGLLLGRAAVGYLLGR